MPVKNLSLRPAHLAFLAGAARIGVTPYFADAENADVETLAALAATYGRAKSKEINQIFAFE
ncbi:MAG: hypothetical protein WAL45_15800 [Terracidiphilus sp.]